MRAMIFCFLDVYELIKSYPNREKQTSAKGSAFIGTVPMEKGFISQVHNLYSGK